MLVGLDVAFQTTQTRLQGEDFLEVKELYSEGGRKKGTGKQRLGERCTIDSQVINKYKYINIQIIGLKI